MPRVAIHPDQTQRAQIGQSAWWLQMNCGLSVGVGLHTQITLQDLCSLHVFILYLTRYHNIWQMSQLRQAEALYK